MSSLEDLTPEARDELALLARKLADNPKTRNPYLKLVREINPEVPMPELDMEQRAVQIESKTREEVESLKAELQKRDAERELEKRRERVKARGHNPEDVEKVMLERGITNHDTAAEFLEAQRRAAPPTPTTTFNPSVMDEKAKTTLSAFWKNPVQAGRNEAAKALTEIRMNNPKPIGI